MIKEVGIIPIKSMTDYKGKTVYYYLLNDEIVELLKVEQRESKRYILEKINLSKLQDKTLSNVLKYEVESNTNHTELNETIKEHLHTNHPYIAQDKDFKVNGKLKVYVMEMMPTPTLIFSIKL